MDKDNYGKKKRNNHRKPGSTPKKINWDEVPDVVVIQLITAATAAGGAVRFGGSRDGGVLALGVYGDGDPYTEWFHDAEEFLEFAHDLIAVYRGENITQE